jgi:hypothetical protein
VLPDFHGARLYIKTAISPREAQPHHAPRPPQQPVPTTLRPHAVR